MTNFMNKMVAVIGGVIIVFLVIILVKVNNTNHNLERHIGELQEDINTLRNSISYLQSSLASQINQINAQIEENSKIYYNHKYEIIGYNKDNDIVSINYQLNLKEYHNEDKVFLVYKNGNNINKVEMTNDNSYFNANINLESKKRYELTLVIEGGSISTQQIGNIDIYQSLKNRLHISYPVISIIHYNGETQATATMSFNLTNNYKDNENLKIISGKITALLNDKTIIDINNFSSLIIDDHNSQYLVIDEEFDYDNEGIKEDAITYSIEMTDAYGFVYYWNSANK